ncbi:MAG: acyl-CoA dehydrogenase [Pseudomonadota bacterium]
MNFHFSDEQQMLSDAAQRFTRDEYGFHTVYRPALVSTHGYSAAHWQRYAQFGWLGLGLPEDFDGLGCSFIETTIILEALGGALALEPYIPTAVLGASLVDLSGNQAQRSALLPGIANGSVMLALAHSEPERRFSLDTLPQTRAQRGAAGWLLNGTKTLAWQAGSADYLIVSATLDGEHALFLIDARADGLSVRDYPLIDGTHAADIALRDVCAADDALLARGIPACALLDQAVDRAILGMSAMALGAIEAVLEITNKYIKERKQFGQAIGAFQASQHRMAEMFIESQEARSAFYRALAHLDDEAGARKAAVSSAKVVIAHAGRLIAGLAIQLHGGYGVTEEYEVSHYYKKLMCYEQLLGDTDFHLTRYAQLMS